MSLSDLLQLLPGSGGRPNGLAGHDWSEAAAAIGVEFPAEYAELIDVLGPGSLDGFIWLLSPFAGNPNLNLIHQLERQTDMLSALRGEATGVKLYSSPAPENVPYPLWPADGGLIPWFTTDNGDVGYFIAAHVETSWPTVISDSRASSWQGFDLGPVVLLSGILSGLIRPTAFPADFPPLAHTFERADVESEDSTDE